MSHSEELELLHQYEIDLEREAAAIEDSSDGEVDRRQFMFLSLAAAAATTFGFGAKALAQGTATPPAGAPAGGRGGGGGRGGNAGPPVPIDNMENVSWTFQPYPGGTGALLEKTYREKGPAAFERQKFVWTPTAGAFYIAPWGSAPFPTSDEDIAFLPAHRLAAAIKAGKLTSTRITKIYLERMKRLNPTLLCAVTIMEEQGLAAAAAADAEIKAGKYRGPLHGIPWGVKDLFATKGVPTTWGAADFENRIFDFDAEVVTRLNNAGAVLIAKLASGQFAEGASWFRGTTKNPWNTSQQSSGSSAGPASGTAAGCVAFGIGTETDGSIVSPTGVCGLSALRPTFGRVSRSGGMVLSWSQDRVGPITRTAEDAAMVFNAIHGADEKDPGTITMPFHFKNDIDLSALRIGVRQNQSADFAAFLDKLKELGAKPTDLGNPPVVAGAAGGIDQESAAAFDAYVQWKAKQLGMDMPTVVATFGRGGGRGGGGGGRGRGAGPDSAAAGRAGAGGDSATVVAAGRAGGGGGGGRGGGRGAADGGGQLNRWLGGRNMTAFDFINEQRRRLIACVAWQTYLKDIDLYVGATNETTPHAMVGIPVAVVQYSFGVAAGRGGGGGGGGRGGRGGAGRGGDSTAAAAAPPPPALNPQPHCTHIAGNLYNDDLILSVAHKYQVHTDWLKEHPKLG